LFSRKISVLSRLKSKKTFELAVKAGLICDEWIPPKLLVISPIFSCEETERLKRATNKKTSIEHFVEFPIRFR